MTGFQLDTSGRVECAASFQPIGWAIWSDLSPLVQGYVEALFASFERWPSTTLGDAKYPALPNANGRGVTIGLGFTDLAPETLALILKDCAEEVARWATPSLATANCGREFWEARQTGKLEGARAHLRPQTPTLSDDGKVYLRSAA